MSQGCSRCGASLPPGARFCEGCGTPAGMAAVGVVDKRSDPVTAPRTESLTTQPQPLPLYPPILPRNGEAAAPLAPWQWGVAIAGGAVFLYNTSLVIFIALFVVSGSSFSFPVSQFVTDLALAGLAGCGVLWALQDRKSALTFLVGGIALRSLIRVLAMIFTGAAAVLLVEWLVVCAASVAALWWLWQKRPREAGDASRLSIALTVLLGAELATVIYGIAVRPAYMRSPDLFAAAIVIGALVLLRVKLPRALGAGASGGATSAGIDPRFRRALMIVVYIVIAIILRVLLRTAFR
jgi:hypothetical protein